MKLFELWHLMHLRFLAELCMLVFYKLRSFQSIRQFQVVLQGNYSQKYWVNARVPQGSVLGTTLFDSDTFFLFLIGLGLLYFSYCYNWLQENLNVYLFYKVSLSWSYPFLYKSAMQTCMGYSCHALNLVYRYYCDRCSSELAELVSLLFCGRISTRYSDKYHEFSVTIPSCLCN